ncbi:aminotransferase, class IV [Alkaliphilus metalliredigens QYMF]|uniref:Aminotransferase, class IV n=1 Tax=Alkaliphilus metalliredigens (strain QYMF) TaxID=293826 RepID=A6TLE0_ALKMQ|nr:aminotransferase class IV [Alkaliphilus metalliredigens]ABR47008.1 aminotransferase, class IV [Alkaliphilus metalliredigens QYMF]
MQTNQLQNQVSEAYFLHNGEVCPIEVFQSLQIHHDPTIYEVLRVAQGVPLFFEEHFQRFVHSAELLGLNFPYSQENLQREIHRLIELNQFPDKNIKIIFNDDDRQQPHLFLFFIPSHYPSHQAYSEGVHTILYEAQRENPNAKVVAQTFREKINEAMAGQKSYEALLVNQKGEITEGSRSNFFCIKGGILYTATAQDVLVGITRSRVITLWQNLGLTVKEQPIPLSFLDKVEALFLTGTSPKVLPIASVNEKKYTSSEHLLMKQLQGAYDQLIETYIVNYLYPKPCHK